MGERLRYARRAGPHAFLSFVEEGAAMFAGLADTTICRDEGWMFLVMWRFIERADMTVRLLLSRVRDKATSPGWMTVLASVGAQDTYLRTYRGALDAGRIVRFLLRDPLFPRSVFHALRQAETCLDHLDRGEHARANVRSEALRLVGRARSELEFLRSSDLLEDLPKRLLALQATTREVGEAVSAQYFSSSPWVAWHDAEVSL
jgi:uncharacterized alpha-E superfamily protein